MSKALLKIEREAVRLSAKDREVLAERLMRSVTREPLTQVEEAWVAEAERRFSAWRRGTRKGVPVERAFKQIRKDLGW
ncbi:MAG: addiction module protein [Nitrospira sp.]|nr:addiction module protein [Nitrospira sp.]